MHVSDVTRWEFYYVVSQGEKEVLLGFPASCLMRSRDRVRSYALDFAIALSIYQTHEIF
jgi:hypothetical protein